MLDLTITEKDMNAKTIKGLVEWFYATIGTEGITPQTLPSLFEDMAPLNPDDSILEEFFATLAAKLPERQLGEIVSKILDPLGLDLSHKGSKLLMKARLFVMLGLQRGATDPFSKFTPMPHELEELPAG